MPDAAERYARIIAAVRDNESYKPTGEPTPTAPYIPLALVALELGEDPAHLAARLDGAVILDNIGMRVSAARQPPPSWSSTTPHSRPASTPSSSAANASSPTSAHKPNRPAHGCGH